jgi:hypothetical protein
MWIIKYFISSPGTFLRDGAGEPHRNYLREQSAESGAGVSVESA